MTTKIEDMIDQGQDATMSTLAVEHGSTHLKAVALRSYSDQKTQPTEEEQITQYLPMVNSIAHKVASYLRPPLSFEDLISAGTVGLIKAVRDFNASHGAQFQTYAYIRIKGAILDELRSSSLLPSSLNRQVKEALELSHKLTQQKGSPPSDEDLADKLGMTTTQLRVIFESARTQRFISGCCLEHNGPSLDESLVAVDTCRPDTQLEHSELVDRLSQSISTLDEKRRQIIVLYYLHHLTMKQIAEVLEVTESRVSQLHASALFNLSAMLSEWKDEP